MKLVKFTRSREELNPEKKSKLGPEKMKSESFDVYVNADEVTYVDDGEFNKAGPNDIRGTRIHFTGGHTIAVDESVSAVVGGLDAAAKASKKAAAAE